MADRPDARSSNEGGGTGAAPYTQDPYPTHAWLRTQAGLPHWPAWDARVGSRFADVADALRRDGIELSAVGQTAAAFGHIDGDERRGLASIERLFSAGLLWSDPPDHDRIRAVVNKALNPRDLERMRPQVAAVIERTLVALPDGPFDVVPSFAGPIPIAVLAELLGIPSADVASVRSWADTLADFMGHPHPDVGLALAAQTVVAEARDYVDALVAGRRAADPAGVIARLAALRSAGAQISEDEFHATVIVLLVGGHRTTAAGIANAILALARNPEQHALLRARPGLMPTAVEEFLRYESPHQRTVRIVREDTTIAGTELRAGETVVLLNGAANRDDEQFVDAHELRLDRQPNRHLAFSSGIHFCIGAPLARIELTEALRAILTRFPGFRLVREPVWLDNHTLRSPASLWIEPVAGRT